MKKIIAIALGVLAVLIGVMIYNVERAISDPVTITPGPAETGRLELHSQLNQVKQQEAQIEKQSWSSAAQLRGLVKVHEHRIDQLTGNTAASEIFAYDHESIARLKKRIAELEAQQPEAPTAEQ